MHDETRDAGRDRQPQEKVGEGIILGRPFGVPVQVAPTWFVVVALVTMMFAPVVESRNPDIGLWRYLVSFTFAVLLYVSVFVHELSHTVVALRFGLPVRRISLYLLGGFSEIEKEPQTPGREFLIAFMGPLVSLGLGGVCLLIVWPLEHGSLPRLLAEQVALANLLVGLFNLLPGLPLDGGRVLQAAVWKATGQRTTGLLVAGWAGRVAAASIVAFPFLMAVPNRGLDPISLVWAGLIGVFVWIGASQAIHGARVRQRLPSLQLRTLARRALPVEASVPLAEALRRATEAGARGLVVVDGYDRPTGLVSEASVGATPEHRRPWVDVGSLCRALEPGLVLTADLEGEDLVLAMQATPATEYLVLEATGEICGVLSTADVDAVFAHR